MGLGILEPREPVVKGTIQLFDDNGSGEHLTTTTHLKHSQDGKILLSPQPSDSPDDPLNRSLLKRDIQYFLVLLATILSGIHGPMLSPVTIQLSIQYGKTITDIAQLSSYMTLAIGLFAYAFSVIVSVLGKRGVVVIGCAILVAADAWGAVASNYNSMLGCRILSGIGQAVFEAISITMVADMYFVHERGVRIGLFIYALQSGVFLGVPIVTQVIGKSGLRWAFGGLAIAEAITLVLLFFLFEETAFKREHVDVTAHRDEDEILAKEEKNGVRHIERTTSASPSTEPRPRSYWSKLNMYQGRFSQQNPLLLLVRVLALNFHPTIFWAAVTGLPASWLVGLSFTVNVLLAAPPWNFSSQAIANLYIAGWIGCTFGMALAMPIDWLAKRAAKRNNNIYEPEFRLFMVVPSTIFVVVGLSLWGWGGSHGASWPAMAVFFVIAAAGSVLINSALIAYLIDAHRQFAIESQVVLFAFKNLMPFAMGYFWVPWWFVDGNQVVWVSVFRVFRSSLHTDDFRRAPYLEYLPALRCSAL